MISIKSMLFVVAVVLSTVIPTEAYAAKHPITFLDYSFSVDLPENYCELDQKSRYYAFNQKAFGKSIKFGIIAGRCSDLKALYAGKISSLPHYIAVEQIGIDRKFIKFKLGSFAYTTLLSTFRIKNFSKLEKRLNEKLKPFDTTLSELGYVTLKKTSSSILYQGFGKLKDEKKQVGVNIFAYTRLLRFIPVAVHVYDEEPTNEVLSQSLVVLNSVISSLGK